MKSAIGAFAFAAAAFAALLPPIDPNNPLTNPATNRDLLFVNPGWLAAKGSITPEQQLTIQNQLIAQKNLEMLAAQLAAQAGVPPPAGILGSGASPAPASVPAPALAPASAATSASQASATSATQAAAAATSSQAPAATSSSQAPAATSSSQAPAAAAPVPSHAPAFMAVPAIQGGIPIFQVPPFAALQIPGKRQSVRHAYNRAFNFPYEHVH